MTDRPLAVRRLGREIQTHGTIAHLPVMKVPRWLAISDSAFAWEREALELIREHLPDHEPWRAWSNFEFLDDEGRVNEVDALILTPQGLLLVEIKSRPGTVEGDAHSWTWTTDGRRRTDDNPLLLTDRKAKRLASLIRKQDALARSKLRPPWVEPVIFLSKVRPPLKIDAASRTHVFLRGRPGHETDDGIIAALTGGLAGAFPSRTPIDANAARAIARAIEQPGIRPSLREKRVGDYDLGLMTGTSPPCLAEKCGQPGQTRPATMEYTGVRI